MELSEKQTEAYWLLREADIHELMYGGAKGGGKSVFGCIWMYLECCHLIDRYNIGPRKFPIPVGFMGRKQSIDFTNTTLETWKRFIPHDCYVLREHNKEIIIDGKVKVDFGGFDRSDVINKFNSAEYARIFLDQAEEISLDDVALLRATLRLVINGQKVPGKALYTANPAQCWLKEEFVDQSNPHQRFVRALPGDNKWTGEEYVQVLEKALAHRPDLLRAYRDGDWTAFEGDDQLILSKYIVDCYTTSPVHDGYLVVCDVARFGDDETVIFVMEGTNIVHKTVWGKSPTTAVSKEITELSRAYGNCPCVVDEIGVGGGVVDQLIDTGRSVIPFNSSNKPTEASKRNNQPIMHNLRSEAWWNASKMFAAHEISCSGMYPRLQSQLTIPRYGFRNGKVLIEDKESIKKRMNRSPDHADTYVMGLWAMKQTQSSGMTASECRRLAKKYGRPAA
ncbi:hypothetical protein CMI37_23085 [Candidatus Pacearchaeota archaeon]|nr:hypothetical protein [Candidatus Pacearchaeota archaeon]